LVGSDARPLHAVVILVDTLREDALRQAHTPYIDDLAAGGLVADRAWTSSTWTVPAVVSLFTGAFSRTHGWDLPTGDLEKRPPLPDMPTLAEVLREAGFATQGLYANGYLAQELGFDRGFDEWRRSSDRIMAREVAKRVAGWSAEEERDRRHFLYVHLLGPHSGLSPSQEARARWELSEEWFPDRNGLLIGRAKRGKEEGVVPAYRRAYHAVVEDADRNVGAILEALAPVRRQTLVVLLSDHGEELGERQGVFGHGWSVAESLTHIPFIVAGPGVEPGRRATASLAEVPDLVTDALGLDHPWPVQSPWQGPLASERHGKQAVLADGRYKGSWHGEQLLTYDLQQDSSGLQEAEGGQEEVRAALERWKAMVPKGRLLEGSVPLEASTLEAIRALGYVD